MKLEAGAPRLASSLGKKRWGETFQYDMWLLLFCVAALSGVVLYNYLKMKDSNAAKPLPIDSSPDKPKVTSLLVISHNFLARHPVLTQLVSFQKTLNTRSQVHTFHKIFPLFHILKK